jgi:predicted enzyme related to lactoylglutathione lyase
MIQQIDVAIDCRDMETMSNFWTSLLEYDRSEPMDDRYWAATHPAGLGPRLVFQSVDDAPRGEKTPFHLDVHVDDIDDVAQQVVHLGGSRIDAEAITEAGSTWIRCVDPEGNVFCVVRAR